MRTLEWSTNLSDDAFEDRSPVMSRALWDSMYVAWESNHEGSWDILGAAIRIAAGAVERIECDTPPREFLLLQNHPNPFNSGTIIEFSLPRSSDVCLQVYDLLGRRVRCLAEEHVSPGAYRVAWDGRDDLGTQVPAGVYVGSLTAGGFIQSIKMVLVR